MCLALSLINYAITHWRPAVYLLGMSFEIIGALMLANRYLNMPLWARLPVVISAIYYGKRAKQAEAIAYLSDERGRVALRGLGFLVIGFIFRSLPSLAELLN